LHNSPTYATIQTTSLGRASRTIPREVFMTTELTIDGLGANGDSAHESIKEHKNGSFPDLEIVKRTGGNDT